MIVSEHGHPPQKQMQLSFSICRFQVWMDHPWVFRDIRTDRQRAWSASHRDVPSGLQQQLHPAGENKIRYIILRTKQNINNKDMDLLNSQNYNWKTFTGIFTGGENHIIYITMWTWMSFSTLRITLETDLTQQVRKPKYKQINQCWNYMYFLSKKLQKARSTCLGRRCTPSLYSPCLVHSSIWAKTWLVKELLITKLGWPWAHPKLTRRPSANKIIWRPFFSVYLSTCGLNQNPCKFYLKF